MRRLLGGDRMPGGVVALQEPDGSTLHCYPPHPAWDTLKAALLGSVSTGAISLARCPVLVVPPGAAARA